MVVAWNAFEEKVGVMGVYEVGGRGGDGRRGRGGEYVDRLMEELGEYLREEVGNGDNGKGWEGEGERKGIEGEGEMDFSPDTFSQYTSFATS